MGKARAPSSLLTPGLRLFILKLAPVATMQLTFAAALAILPFLVSASPAPVPQGAKLTFSRRSFSKDGVVDINALRSHVAHVRA